MPCRKDNAIFRIMLFFLLICMNGVVLTVLPTNLINGSGTSVWPDLATSGQKLPFLGLVGWVIEPVYVVDVYTRFLSVEIV